MATLNLNAATGFELDGSNFDSFNDAKVTYTDSESTYIRNDGAILDFLGDFTYDSEGRYEPGSTVTQVEEIGPDGTVLFILSDLSMPTSDVFGANFELRYTLPPLFSGRDTLNGTDFDDHLRGYGGNDTLNGGAGDDTLDGGAGLGSMTGGAGNDTYLVDTVEDVVVEQPKGGHDIVYASVDYTLSANVEDLVLVGTSDFTGGGNASDNRLTGNVGNDALDGMAGDDTLDGGIGSDTLTGGSGNDVFIVNDSDDVVVEAAKGGHDFVEASVSYTLSANVEDLTLTGSAKIGGTGNGADNAITGNAAANHLYGLGGDDHVIGGGGSDTLDGGTGADTMTGGAGDDTYLVQNRKDVVTEAAGAGHDLVKASISYTLGANVEDLTLTGSGTINGTGNTLANTITGNAHDNVLKGDDGNDVLTGGKGDDTLVGGYGADTLVGGHGTDTLTGGNDADTFRFADGDLGASKSSADVITDFSHKAGDLIDLGGVDARLGGDHDAFTFLGTSAFDGKAGELRYAYSGADTFLMGDTNGDKQADFMIKLDGHVALQESDFTGASLLHG